MEVSWQSSEFFNLILCGVNYLCIPLWCIPIYRWCGAQCVWQIYVLYFARAHTYAGQDWSGRYGNIYIIYISVHYEQLFEFSAVLLLLLLCSSL